MPEAYKDSFEHVSSFSNQTTNETHKIVSAKKFKDSYFHNKIGPILGFKGLFLIWGYNNPIF